MFDQFIRQQIKTQGTTINLVRGGNGDPVLVLHGYPQTHVCWHRVAPILADRFTVVCPDLRGFGDSGKPASDSEHLTYSKRVMAQDQLEVMQNLGFNEFAVVGHDRGARVAHRMALDHSANVTRLAPYLTSSQPVRLSRMWIKIWRRRLSTGSSQSSLTGCLKAQYLFRSN